MSDDVEHRFRAYRPAGPPPDLRARILRAAEAPPSNTFREWLPAIAATAVIALLSALNYQHHTALEARLTVPDDLQPVEQWLPGPQEGVR